jgi:hypothetical protein
MAFAAFSELIVPVVKAQRVALAPIDGPKGHRS